LMLRGRPRGYPPVYGFRPGRGIGTSLWLDFGEVVRGCGPGYISCHALNRTPRFGHLPGGPRMVGQSPARQPSPASACSLPPVPAEPRRAPAHDREGRSAAGDRAIAPQLFTTCRLLVTEKTPETPLARMPAVSLSVWLSTTPSSVTCPFFTMMRMGLMTLISYFCSEGKP